MLRIRLWKDIDYMYSVSSDGLVMNKIKGKLLKQHKKGKKPKYDPNRPLYLTVTLHGKKFAVHRLVATYFIPNPLNLPQVNHIDGIKNHNWVTNLEWVTNKENIIKAYNQGLIYTKNGENHHNAKHTEKDVRLVIKMLNDGVPYSEITKITGFSSSMIYDIKAGNIWKEISKEYKLPDIIKKPNFSEYYKTIDDLILSGYKTHEIRKIYPIEDFTNQQWRSLVCNRKKNLKKKGLL